MRDICKADVLFSFFFQFSEFLTPQEIVDLYIKPMNFILQCICPVMDLQNTPMARTDQVHRLTTQ
jgi:hypothetical protein